MIIDMSGKKGLNSPLCNEVRLKGLLRNISGKKVTIIGLGLFGGGEGAARFLCKKGACVTVADLKSEKELAPAIAKLEGLPIRFRFGPQDKAIIKDSDLVVLNTAVPRNANIVLSASEAGKPLTSPMNIFLALCKGRISAVTGSVGKSTTTAMLAQMLKAAGKSVYMGGNIGISMLDSVDQITENDEVVLEISSVQLEDAAALPFSPQTAIVTNVLLNHLDWYDSFETYAEAKKNIIKYQKNDDIAILNAESTLLSKIWKQDVMGDLMFFDGSGSVHSRAFDGVFLDGKQVVYQHGGEREALFKKNDMQLIGDHNLKNALAAAAAAKWLGCEPAAICSGLISFRPLEHRMEKCSRFEGMTFYNDSDSTTPDSTIAAIEAVQPPITLICGGKDKGLPFNKLADAVIEKVDVLITLGSCGPAIAQSVREAGLGAGHTPIIIESETLKDAVDTAYNTSMPGSSILFSPASSSFDMFQNFADRGDTFKKLVKKILEPEKDKVSA